MDNSDQQTEQPQGGLSKLKENSLKAAGVAYLIGDAAIVASGLATGNKARTLTGLAWGAGGAFPAVFGNPSEERQLRMVTEKLGAYLRKQGIEIPKDPKMQALMKEGGVAEHAANFFYQHPSEALNAIYALGATQMVAGGLKETSKGAKGTGAFDVASGVLVGAGALAGLLVKEKQPDPDNPPKTGMEKFKQWAQEKPLRVSGALYTLNNAAMLGAAISKRKEAKQSAAAMKDYRLRFLTTGTYIFANAMLAMSSKNHHDGGHSVDMTSQLADLSAKVIAAQPRQVQEALVQNVAGYLSAQPEIDKTAPEIAELLHSKLASVKQQPMQQASWQERTRPVLSGPQTPQL